MLKNTIPRWCDVNVSALTLCFDDMPFSLLPSFPMPPPSVALPKGCGAATAGAWTRRALRCPPVAARTAFCRATASESRAPPAIVLRPEEDEERRGAQGDGSFSAAYNPSPLPGQEATGREKDPHQSVSRKDAGVCVQLRCRSTILLAHVLGRSCGNTFPASCPGFRVPFGLISHPPPPTPFLLGVYRNKHSWPNPKSEMRNEMPNTKTQRN